MLTIRQIKQKSDVVEQESNEVYCQRDEENKLSPIPFLSNLLVFWLFTVIRHNCAHHEQQWQHELAHALIGAVASPTVVELEVNQQARLLAEVLVGEDLLAVPQHKVIVSRFSYGHLVRYGGVIILFFANVNREDDVVADGSSFLTLEGLLFSPPRVRDQYKLERKKIPPCFSGGFDAQCQLNDSIACIE